MLRELRRNIDFEEEQLEIRKNKRKKSIKDG